MRDEGVLNIRDGRHPVLEQQLIEARRPTEDGTQLVVDPDRIERLLGSLRDRVQEVEMSGREAVVVCAPGLRPALRKTVALALPNMPVLSYTEVTCAPVQVETVGMVSDATAIVA